MAQKLNLRRAFISTQSAYQGQLRQYLNAISGGKTHLAAMKIQAETGLEECNMARKRYADHVEEHGC